MEKLDSKKESEILFNLVKMRYGERLTPDELEEVKKSVDVIVDTTRSLRNVKLENWDEPFATFKPYRRGK